MIRFSIEVNDGQPIARGVLRSSTVEWTHVSEAFADIPAEVQKIITEGQMLDSPCWNIRAFCTRSVSTFGNFRAMWALQKYTKTKEMRLWVSCGYGRSEIKVQL